MSLTVILLKLLLLRLVIRHQAQCDDHSDRDADGGHGCRSGLHMESVCKDQEDDQRYVAIAPSL